MAGNVSFNTEYEKAITGSIAANGASVDLAGPNGATIGLQISGTWAGTLIVEASQNGTIYETLDILKIPSLTFSNALTANGLYVVNATSYTNIRVRATAWTSGSADIAAFGNDAAALNFSRSFLFGANGTQIGNSNDRLKVQINPSVVSTSNSSNTPLAANATFTGAWEDCSTYSTITISVFTSHPSAVNGLKFETSTNGIDWDDGDIFSIPAMVAGGAKVYSFGVTSQYFRIVYTNGGTLQTTFRLQTILHSVAIKNSSHRVDDAIVDDDDAELMKSIITGKSAVSGAYKNVATDDDGRLLISGESEIISPLPSIKVVERRVLTASGVYAFTQNISQNTAIKEFTFGGRGAGEGMFGRYVAATENFVPGGDFESAPDVALWTNTGVGDGATNVPTYSTAQAFTGTGSLKLGPQTRSDQNHYPEITYTWPSPVSMDGWRYIQAYFRNEAPTGGAVTRTISIRLTDTAGSVRIYQVAGLTNVAPFNTTGWIQILGEIRIPSSQIGTTFDINNIVSISLRMQDSGNKAYTAIYWDTVKTVGAIDIIQKIYTNGNTIPLQFDPVVLFSAGEVMYLALRNNDTTSKEYQLTVAGVDIT